MKLTIPIFRTKKESNLQPTGAAREHYIFSPRFVLVCPEDPYTSSFYDDVHIEDGQDSGGWGQY